MKVAAQQATPTSTAGPTARAEATPSSAATTAPSSSGGQTASPAPVVPALPAAVPKTGGLADTGGTLWALVLAVYAAPLIITGSAALAVRLRKR
ncbi:MAG: hypothetical protein E6J43_04530 [Chloroflexi bacterium]|nr:MAG: hypothetical protein E6J43_04530 [Chloroflexota bacterium]